LKKVEAKSLELFWQDFVEYVNCSNSYALLKGPYFWMAKNWRNSGFVTKFLTKYALFDERKIFEHFWRQNPLEPNYRQF